VGQLNPLRRAGKVSEVSVVPAAHETVVLRSPTVPCRAQVVEAAFFLLSPQSSYVNGQALPVCGGLSSSLPVVPAKL
jgi:hypothetical protein